VSVGFVSLCFAFPLSSFVYPYSQTVLSPFHPLPGLYPHYTQNNRNLFRQCPYFHPMKNSWRLG
jgi:hypothetical protein